MLPPRPARPPAPPPAPHPGVRRQVEPPAQLLRLFCAVLVCSGEIAALADFSGKTRPALPCAPGGRCPGEPSARGGRPRGLGWVG